jgi:cell division protein FtsI (penicillin-binding protein 3)/stage V sporulation protein D (sporulation-specific penicillin-binding protein)
MQHRNRAIWILACLACGFTVISFNLIQIQLVDHDRYWRMAIKNHLHPEKIEPTRGTIFDNDGNVLAETQVRTDLFLDGKLVDHPAVQLAQLAAILQVPEAQLTGHFDPRNRHDPLADHLTEDVVAKLRALKWPSLILTPHEQRFYPNNNLAAHVLGFVGPDGRGLAGIEKQMDPSLNGVAGERWVEEDGLKQEIAGYQSPETPVVDGYDVTLTIRMAIQHVVEDELDQIVQMYSPNAAYIIVMDPHTGEIMAMGSRPTYDPNDTSTFKPEAVRDRCITDGVEPGSIFKIITLAAGLNEGLINLNTPIFCENGLFHYCGKTLKDDEPNGTLPVMEVMAQSSNIGFAKIALNYLHEQKLYQYARAFGIGSRTGLFENQGESAGLFRPVSQWSGLSITRIPMGQEVLATPIQMVMAMSVIANGGRLMAPRLVEKVTDKSGRLMQVYQPRLIRQVISPDAAHDVARALEQVTIDGTAKKIRIQDANGDCHSYAGKTGTAQKFVDGAYSHTKFVSSFLGFMPVDDPAFVALVMIDEPHTSKYYGSEVSAPVFASVAKQMAQLLNLPADLPASGPDLTSNNR